jgi:hypothetical protein
MGALGSVASLFGGGGSQTTFKPAQYKYEKGQLNPAIYSELLRGMRGKPQTEDWQGSNALNRTIQEQYRRSRAGAESSFASRGVFDSGWMARKNAQLLGQRAGQQGAVSADMWSNIANRQAQARQMAASYLASARAGSGTYKTESGGGLFG